MSGSGWAPTGGRRPTETPVTEFCDEKLTNIKIIIFLIHEQFSRPSCKCCVTQKIRNSSVVHHRTKSPFGAKICVNISFQLLLYIMKVKSQEDKQFYNLNFGDVMWKPGILTHLIWLQYQCHLEVFWVGKGQQINTPLIFLRLSLITCRVCCVVYKFAITHCHNWIKTHRNSYQCSLFHLQIHLCTWSYKQEKGYY